jgi:hypothetical protein
MTPENLFRTFPISKIEKRQTAPLRLGRARGLRLNASRFPHDRTVHAFLACRFRAGGIPVLRALEFSLRENDETSL